MHIYFSGIGGTAIGPLALIAKQAGYEVSGSDKQDSQYIEYLRKHGIADIHIGQSQMQITAVHEAKPIDWFVYTSALPLENPDAPELLLNAGVTALIHPGGSLRDRDTLDVVNRAGAAIVLTGQRHFRH